MTTQRRGSIIAGHIGDILQFGVSGWFAGKGTEGNLDPSTQIPADLLAGGGGGGGGAEVYDICASFDPLIPWIASTATTWPAASRAIAVAPICSETISAIDFQLSSILPASGDTLQALVYTSNGLRGQAKRPVTPVAWSLVKSSGGAGANQQTWTASALNTINFDGTGSPASIAVTPGGHYLVLVASSTTGTFGRSAITSGSIAIGRCCIMNSFTFSDSAPPSWANAGGSAYIPLLVAH